MTISQELCIKSANEVGKIGITQAFSPSSIDRSFYKRYKDILETPQRGGGKGFWLWKPYIVNEYIRSIYDGDILIYCDSGVEWVNSVNILLRHWGEPFHKEEDILLFSNGHRHLDWCKAEVICSMLPEYAYNVRNFPYKAIQWKQVQASVMLFRVNAYTREFCRRWLSWSCIPGFIDDTLRSTQLPEFREHRNDQSVLTNLQIQDDISLHWWPAQYGGPLRKFHPNDCYPQMFYHHRYRNDEWFNYIKVHQLSRGVNPDRQSINEALNHFMKQPKNV